MNIKMLKPAVSLIFASLVINTVNATPIQWEIASGGNDHWYEFITLGTNEFDARSNALSSIFDGESGYLVTVLSQGEQDFIKTLAGNSQAWIGASDSINEGDWIWMDGPESGQALTFSFWANAEPNDYGNGEDFVAMNWKSNGRWNDYGTPHSNISIGSIVEYNNRTSVPEPSTLAIFGLALLGLGSRKFYKQ